MGAEWGMGLEPLLPEGSGMQWSEGAQGLRPDSIPLLVLVIRCDGGMSHSVHMTWVCSISSLLIGISRFVASFNTHTAQMVVIPILHEETEA